MKRKTKRLWGIGVGLLFLGVGTAMVLYTLDQNLLYFRTPSDVIDDVNLMNHIDPSGDFRVGGLVVEHSVRILDHQIYQFEITDGQHTMIIQYKGFLPDLFREGQGVIATGHWHAHKFFPEFESRPVMRGVFIATKLLAKHDENYMPPEIKKGMK